MLFVATGATNWNDPGIPWTMAGLPLPSETDLREYILKHCRTPNRDTLS